jgi:hypothetical protein
MEEDQQNCPFCQSKKEREFSSWTFSREKWKDLRKKHKEEHGPIDQPNI